MLSAYLWTDISDFLEHCIRIFSRKDNRDKEGENRDRKKIILIIKIILSRDRYIPILLTVCTTTFGRSEIQRRKKVSSNPCDSSDSAEEQRGNVFLGVGLGHSMLRLPWLEPSCATVIHLCDHEANVTAPSPPSR